MDLLKRAGAAVAHGAELTGLLAALERTTDRAAHRLRVLTYHRVADPQSDPDLYPGLISATPERFAQQMTYLAANYRVVDLEQVVEACRRSRPLPPRSVLITFDDAYRDFADCAWPVLRRLRLPATLFVPTAFPGRPERAFWWDRLYQAVERAPGNRPLELATGRMERATPAQRTHSFRRLRTVVKSLPHDEAMDLVDQICEQLIGKFPEGRVLDWETLRKLRGEGVTLAPHTRTHPMLTRVGPERVREEVLGSLHDLERETGDVLPVLAYPAGGFDESIVRLVEQEGFELAFTTLRGVNNLWLDDRLQLRRIPVGQRVTEPLLRAQLLSWTSNLGRLFPGTRRRRLGAGGRLL